MGGEEGPFSALLHDLHISGNLVKAQWCFSFFFYGVIFFVIVVWVCGFLNRNAIIDLIDCYIVLSCCDCGVRWKSAWVGL